jgi:hypothetical protein
MENINKAYVIGTLTEVEIREGQKDGKEYIAGKFKVAVSEENIVEHTFFSYETTREGKVSSRYKNYQGIERLKGQRIKVTSGIGSRAFYSDKEGQVIHFNEVNASFINPVKETDENTSTFEYSGYVVKPLHERLNKEEELVAYEMEIGQANYKGDNLVLVRFTVNPDNTRMVEGVQTHYAKGTTVSIIGEIKHNVTIVEQKIEVMLGEPTVKHFENVLKTYEITGGKEAIVSDSAYTPAQINELENAYQTYLTDVEAKAKETAKSGQSTAKDAPGKSDKHKLV